MLIKQNLNGSKGSFYVAENEITLASMTYSMAGNELMIIDHTEVSDELKGKQAGYQLIKAAVEYARSNKIKILPLCPFARSVFDKKKDEIGDVLRGN